MYGTADPKSDENSDETLNLVLITESVKLLECQKDNDWEANFGGCATPMIKMMNIVLKNAVLDLS